MAWNNLNTHWRSLSRFIKEEKLFLLILLLYTFVLFVFQIVRIYSGVSGAWDLGIFVQVLSNTLRGSWFNYNVEPWWCGHLTCSFLGVHLCWDLLLILPLFALHPSPVTLVAIKLFVLHFFSLIALYLYLRKLVERSIARLLVLLYAMHPGIIGAALFDFHCEDFFPLFFFLMMYFLESRNFFGFLVSEILTILALEHFAGYLGMFLGFYVFATKRWKYYKVNLNVLALLMTTSLYAWSGFLLFHAFTHYMASYRSDLTKQLFLTKQVHELSSSNVLQDSWLKLSYFVELFAPFLFIPLLEYEIIFPVLLWMLFAFLNNIQPYYLIDNQYSYVTIPILMVAFVEAIAYDRKRLNGLLSSKKRFLALLILGLMISAWLASIVVVNNVPTVNDPFSRILIVKEVLDLINASSNQSLLLSDNFFVFYSTRNNSYAIIPVIVEPKNSSMRYLKLCWTKKLLNALNYSYIVLDTSKMESDVRETVFRNLNYSKYGLYALIDGIFIYRYNWTRNPVIFEPVGYRYELPLALSNCLRIFDYCLLSRSQAASNCSAKFSNLELFHGTYLLLLKLGESLPSGSVLGVAKLMITGDQLVSQSKLVCGKDVCVALLPVPEYHRNATLCLALSDSIAASELKLLYASPRLINLSITK
jgi:uncharacterized membrane protein